VLRSNAKLECQGKPFDWAQGKPFVDARSLKERRDQTMTGRVRIWMWFLILVTGTPAVAVAQARADLAGVWKLNADLSTSGAQAASERAGIGERRAPLGGGIGGVGRGPAVSGGYSGSGGRADPEDLAKAREGLRLASLTPDRLTIVLKGETFVVTDGNAVSQTWTPNGKTTTSEIGALTVETKIKWDGPALVIERKFEGGVKATDRYTVSGNPRHLVVASKIEKIPGERDRTFQRIYDLQ
jgi:hypothetical protein